jgi:hypothetical protein
MLKRFSYLVAVVVAAFFAFGCSSMNVHAGGGKCQVKTNPAGTSIKVHEGHGDNVHIKVKDNPSGTSVKVH